MKILRVAAVALLIPFAANAQTQQAAPTVVVPESSGASPLVIAGALIGATVVADILSGGAFSAPVLRFIGMQAAPAARAAAPAAARAAAPAAAAAPAVVAAAPAAAPAAAAPAAAAARAAAPAAATAAARPWWRLW